MNLHQLLLSAKIQLREAGIASANLDAELLLAFVLGESREYLLRHYDQLLAVEQQAQFKQLLRRRISREPMAQLLGKREFYGRDFVVTKDTLDPRPDSETLVEALFQHLPNRNVALNILDVGVGTGCLLLTLLSEYQNATGVGTDISEAALAVATQNGEILGVGKRVNWKLQDGAIPLEASFDLIISNPPYIPAGEIAGLEKEVAQYEPKLALDGGADGLDCYRSYAPAVVNMLKPNGLVVFEIGQGQEAEVISIYENAGLKHVKNHSDLAGIVRALVFKKPEGPQVI